MRRAAAIGIGADWATSVCFKPPFLWDCGWPSLWKWDDQHIISSRWLVDGGFIHFAKRNEFALQPGSYGVAVQQEQSSGAIAVSNTLVSEFQPMNSVYINSTYSLPGRLGGNHSIKFGYNWIRFENYMEDNAGGAAEAQEIYSSGAGTPFSVPLAVNFYRPGFFDAFNRQQSAYVQDTYTHKRWTLNLGVRWDHQTDSEKGFNVPASPYEGQLGRNLKTGTTDVPFTFLPAVNYPGAQGGVAWNTFAPRLGVVYDLFGTGKTVLKASYGQYFDQRTTGLLSDTYDTVDANTAQSFVQYPWNGATANGLPLMSGVTLINLTGGSALRTSGNNYQPGNPAATTSPNSVDPGIKDPKTQEITAGVSQQVAPGFAVTVTYTYRRYTNFIWKRLNGITSANYYPCTTSPTAAVPCINPLTGVNTPLAATPCPTTVAPTAPSKNWMLNASLTIQSTRQYWTAPDSYQDPTNIAQQNGAQLSPTSSPGGGFPISVSP